MSNRLGRVITLGLVGLLALAGCSSTQKEPLAQVQIGQASTDNIRAHMAYLASDELTGRFPGTPGHEAASEYIAQEFAKYGLKAAGTDGFMQRVVLRKGKLDQTSPELVVLSGNKRTELAYPKEFMTSISMNDTQVDLTAEAVFVGYGIVAPEFGINDFANVDVVGKIIVRLPGKPKVLLTDVGAHLASSSMRRKYAEDAGAIGVIVISDPEQEETRPYSRQLNYIHSERMDWLNAQGNASSASTQIIGGAYLPIPSAQILFANAPQSLDSVYEKMANDEAIDGFALNASVTFKARSSHEDITSPNVVGMVEGSDPILKNEYVLYSAHSDHLGIGKSVKKDKINNGALDNAIGTAVMLETARMFAQLPQKPKRSMLFVAVTAEEKGLLGSDYYAQNPTVPLESIVANVNLDMPLITFNFADVIAFGAEHSTMGQYVERATANANIALTPDPWPQMNLFTRSDHYSFVKQGIPAIFLLTGITSFDADDDAENVLMNFLKTNYHTPQDDMNQAFHWGAAYNFTQVNFNIGLEVANADDRPRWYPDSFFGQTFGKAYNQIAQ
ncbi:MAG: M28 family peptidase [Alteromonadaceae bacterium]|nr:M28 family peptidase [Alteromonadaceae bacterium]